MSNTLQDLNNHLFAQIARLSADDATGDKLKQEIDRTEAITKVSKEVISNAKLALDGAKFEAEYQGYRESKVPAMLTSSVPKK